MTYEQLFLAERRRPSNNKKQELPEETESDRARLLFSNSFRRLHRKTQVFPLDDNSVVRTRLTHSLEVAHIGRAIAKKVTANLLDKGEITSVIQLAFIDIVETACLLHDIGNPPFGHFGEYAIKDWCKQNLNKLVNDREGNGGEIFSEDELKLWNEKLFPDFLWFDGNPQGFRIIASLQWSVSEHGLNLLYPQLAASIKYPFPPHALNGSPKPGYFYSEESIVNDIWERLKLKKDKRFPLNFIVEAADDIAYCLSDIDDAFEKEIFTEDFFEKKIEELIDEQYREEFNTFYNTDKPNDEFATKYFWFKIKITNKLIDKTANCYLTNNDSILSGQFIKKSLLSNETFECKVLIALKTFSRQYIDTRREVENIELAGYSIITGIFDSFTPLLKLDKTEFRKLINNESTDKEIEKHLYNRLPKRHKKVYDYSVNNNNEVPELYYRIHLFIDFVAGMTDRFALQMHQLLKGINIEKNI